MWEQDIGKVFQEKSYLLERVVIGLYSSEKYLSVGAHSQIKEIEDIDDIVDISEEDCVSQGVVVEGDIVGVDYLEQYLACYGCNMKVETASDEGILDCSKCGMMLKTQLGSTKMIAKVVMRAVSNKKIYNITMFEEIISKIVDGAEGKDNIRKRLLLSPQAVYSIDKRNICFAVTTST